MIPVKLSKINNLQLCHLFENYVGGITTEVSQLIYLSKLSLFINKLVGSIPIEFQRLILWYTFNKLFINKDIGSIPIEFQRLIQVDSLVYFQLFVNELESIIPLNIGKYSNLSTLDVLDSNIYRQHTDSVCKFEKPTFVKTLQQYDKESQSNMLVGTRHQYY